VPHEKLSGESCNGAVCRQKNLTISGLAKNVTPTLAAQVATQKNNWYRRSSAGRFLKLARKARIPLYLSFAQRKIIYRLLSANNPE